MSAALTMPGLFPLVGIAGEDDRDALDLALQNVDPGVKNGPPGKEIRFPRVPRGLRQQKGSKGLARAQTVPS